MAGLVSPLSEPLLGSHGPWDLAAGPCVTGLGLWPPVENQLSLSWALGSAPVSPSVGMGGRGSTGRGLRTVPRTARPLSVCQLPPSASGHRPSPKFPPTWSPGGSQETSGSPPESLHEPTGLGGLCSLGEQPGRAQLMAFVRCRRARYCHCGTQPHCEWRSSPHPDLPTPGLVPGAHLQPVQRPLGARGAAEPRPEHAHPPQSNVLSHPTPQPLDLSAPTPADIHELSSVAQGRRI